MKRLRKCLLCHKKLGLVKFKTADGYICKYCYRISSLDYTKTVTSMTLADLKQVVQQAPQEKMITDSANFMITRRINGYVLFDDQHELLCLPNNRRFSAVNLKPEYFPYDSIEVVQTLNEEIVVKGKHLCTVQVKIVSSPEKRRDLLFSFRNQLKCRRMYTIRCLIWQNRSHRNCEHWLL